MLHFFVRQMLLRLKEAITYFMVVIMKEDDYMMRNFYGNFFMTYVELNIEKRFANYQILFHNHYETQQNILRFEIFWLL